MPESPISPPTDSPPNLADAKAQFSASFDAAATAIELDEPPQLERAPVPVAPGFTAWRVVGTRGVTGYALVVTEMKGLGHGGCALREISGGDEASTISFSHGAVSDETEEGRVAYVWGQVMVQLKRYVETGVAGPVFVHS